MASGEWGPGPEQQWGRPTPEAAGPNRMDAVRAAGIELARQGLERGKDGLVHSVDSGLAEKVGHRAIDVAAKSAKASLLAAGPGGIVGRMVAGRAINALEQGAHNRLGSALDVAASRVDQSRQTPNTLPPSPGHYELPPAPAGTWGAPAASEYQAPHIAPAETQSPATWGAPSTAESSYGSPVDTAPDNSRWGGPTEIVPATPPSADNQWARYEMPAPLPEEKKRGLFRRKPQEPSALPITAPAPDYGTWGAPANPDAR